MRKALVLVVLLISLPLAAQNTDIESLSGLQFNFGNPGARSLGMGGAFLGRADDASAAEANPAGLTILRKPEVSLEVRNYQEQQLFSTSGTFPEVNRTSFSHYSQRADISFASIVYPIKSFTIGGYYHKPLRNEGVGQVVPERNEFTGAVRTDVPNFYLPKMGNTYGTPVTRAECEKLRLDRRDFFACLEFTILPFLSFVDIEQETFGFAGAWKFKKLSLGATVRYQTFREEAFTYRVTPTFDFSSISVQTTGDAIGDEIEGKEVNDLTFSGGFKYEVNDKISIGGVYKQGPQFSAPTFAANDSTDFEFVKVSDTMFHVPDVLGLGISVQPIPVLTVNFDAVHVTYSNLVDDFVSINETIRSIDEAYEANDVTELHLGAEYFFSTKIPFAVRAGVWRDPAHNITYRGPLNDPSAVASAILYPEGDAQTHFSVGAGVAWPRFQIDVAYDTSKHYKVGSISMVTRF